MAPLSVTDPANQAAVQGAAEAGALVRIWNDANKNGLKDAGEGQEWG